MKIEVFRMARLERAVRELQTSSQRPLPKGAEGDSGKTERLVQGVEANQDITKTDFGFGDDWL